VLWRAKRPHASHARLEKRERPLALTSICGREELKRRTLGTEWRHGGNHDGVRGAGNLSAA
jgi:hypothetical protein